MKHFVLFLLISLLLVCAGCSPTAATEVETAAEDVYQHIEDEKARALIKASVEFAGGLERWNALKTMSYTKFFSLLDAEGEVEKVFDQLHQYQLDEGLIHIRSVENGDTIITQQQQGEYTRTINGALQSIEDTKLIKAINTSLYVIGIPFKLLDPGAQISYLGQDTLAGGSVAEVIEVRYDAAAHTNHSTSDVWRYYFSTDEPTIVANWVDAGDHFSLIENLSFQRVGGLLWHGQRRSYRVDSAGNRLYLRAEYTYDNYEVAF